MEVSPRWGWMFGTGLEYAMTSAWSTKVEYNFLDFGTRTAVLQANVAAAGASGPADPHIPIRERIHLIKLGVNYHFAPGAIAVRY